MSMNERVYYASPTVIIVKNGASPVIKLRRAGRPTKHDWADMDIVLELCHMEMEGRPYRENGTWCFPVQERRRDADLFA